MATIKNIRRYSSSSAGNAICGRGNGVNYPTPGYGDNQSWTPPGFEFLGQLSIDISKTYSYNVDEDAWPVVKYYYKVYRLSRNLCNLTIWCRGYQQQGYGVYNSNIKGIGVSIQIDRTYYHSGLINSAYADTTYSDRKYHPYLNSQFNSGGLSTPLPISSSTVGLPIWQGQTGTSTNAADYPFGWYGTNVDNRHGVNYYWNTCVSFVIDLGDTASSAETDINLQTRIFAGEHDWGQVEIEYNDLAFAVPSNKPGQEFTIKVPKWPISIQTYDGTEFIDSDSTQVYTGTEWKDIDELKIYNGIDWVDPD